MFPPIFPIYVSALVPLYRYAPLVWFSGVLCLWLTRYTHQLAGRWRSAYYVLSAFLRPLGILLIGVGWLALYAPDPGYLTPVPGLGILWWRPVGNWTEVLCYLAIAACSALGLWAVVTLGLRRSFLFRRLDDPLVVRGPYALVRHPQFLAAIGITFFGTRLFDPYGPMALFGDITAYYHSPQVNWALFTVALWVLSILEDRELAAHFGQEYKEYARRVSRLFPN